MISPIRRETNFKEEFPLGSQLTWEEYCETWKPFNSTSIEMRNRTYGNFAGLCYAGMSSGWIDFVTGNMRSCVPGEYMDNIYEDISRKIKFKTECHLCDKGFCSHNNMFLSKRQNETGTLLSWYECFNNIDRNGNSTYSDDMRKATDYCCDY